MRNVSKALRRRQLGTHDAFHAFNGARNGLLSCGELGAGLHWLGMRLEERELHDVVLGLDDDGDGLVSLDEWCGGLAGDLAESEPSTQGRSSPRSRSGRWTSRALRGRAPAGGPGRPDPGGGDRQVQVQARRPEGARVRLVDTQHGRAERALSFWAPDLDTTPLQRR